MEKVALLGRPNSGKSSLFNLLTGLNQRIGNFPGVTVQQKKGKFHDIEIIDLPGLQTLQSSNLDEKISKQELFKLTEKDRVLFIANGMQLEESLVLFSQVADLQIPIFLAINFKDEIENNGIEIDLKAIEARFGCPVILFSAQTGDELDTLRKLIETDQFKVPNSINRSQYDSFDSTGTYINTYRSLLEQADNLTFWEKDYRSRKGIIQGIIGESSTRTASSYLTRSQKWDKVLLHPIWGLIIFLVVLFIVFQGVFTLAEYPMGWIETAFNGLADLFDARFWKAVVLGVGAIIVFVPPIAILFFLIGILEQTGYLSRISFIADAFLKKFGLSGHSVVPLMSSWACAIPAIMSARIISNPKERFAVIMATPLMTCSARLPVYAILIIVLFPDDSVFWGAKGLTLLALYLLGLTATLLVAWIVNRNSNIPSSKNWVLELPVFRKPNWQNIGITVYQKTKTFVIEAGKIILAISILLFIASEFSPVSDASMAEKLEEAKNQNPQESEKVLAQNLALEYSYLGYLGKGIEPVVRPLGYDWKIGIALLSSFAAREVFASTLVTIYSIEEIQDEAEDDTNLRIADKFRNDLIKQGKEDNLTAIAVSLLLFYVFAMQCMSTLAIVQRETNSWKYALLQFTFFFVLAYSFAFTAFQLLS